MRLSRSRRLGGSVAMLLKVRAEASYDLPAQMFVLLMVEPPLVGANHRVVEETLTTTVTPHSELWTDSAGNPQRRLVAPAGPFSFTFEARIDAGPNPPLEDDLPEARPEEVPADAMVYTL